jgi:hypothetical protein
MSVNQRRRLEIYSEKPGPQLRQLSSLYALIRLSKWFQWGRLTDDGQDEIDAIAPARGSDEGGSQTGDRVLTSLLTEMDGIEELNGVIVLAATNRPEIIVRSLDSTICSLPMTYWPFDPI